MYVFTCVPVNTVPVEAREGFEDLGAGSVGAYKPPDLGSGPLYEHQSLLAFESLSGSHWSFV
jgi:hypothetical protein